MVAFVEEYLGEHRTAPLEVLDVGSQIVTDSHATYRPLFDAPSWVYSGMDVEPGLNVDVAVADAYRWDDIDADRFDVVVSGQALEHVQFFWLTAFEIARVLKPGGITMLIAPSGGPEHRYPVDCWRYYPDGVRAMATMLGFEVLDAGTDWAGKPWSDTHLVMRKPLLGDSGRVDLLRRRAQAYASVFGGGVADAVPGAAVAPSVLSQAEAGKVTARLARDAAAAQAAVAAPAPAPTTADTVEPAATGWRSAVRRHTPDRVLAVYRAARYGRSH